MKDELYFYQAKLIRVIDGDTFVMDVDLGFHLWRHTRVRLYDVDTPEIRGWDKVRGKQVAEKIAAWFVGKTVYIHSKHADAFGRALAYVYDQEGNSLNKYILDNKLTK